jgi:tetratricopeptide (TPR) repeat protein
MGLDVKPKKSKTKPLIYLGIFLFVLVGILVVPLVMDSGSVEGKKKQAEEAISKGDAFFDDQKYEEAIIEWKNALQFDRQQYRVNFKVAKAYWAQGKKTQALREFRQSVQKSPGFVEGNIEMANIFFGQGDYESADTYAEAVIKADSTNKYANLILSRIAVIEGDFEEADRLVAVSMASDPKYLEADVHQGRIYYITGDTLMAEEYLKGVIGKYPDRFGAHLALANLYRSAGNRRGAEKTLETMVVTLDTSYAAWLAVGNYYSSLEAGDKQAVEAYKAAIALDDADGRGYAALALAHLKNGRFSESIVGYDAAISRNRWLTDAKKRLACLLLIAGQTDRADTLIGELMDGEFYDLENQYLKGRLNVSLGKYKEASSVLEKLMAAKPNMRLYPFTYDLGYLLGIAHYKEGRITEAREALLQAITFNPGLVNANVLLAEISLMTGRNKESAEAARRVLAADPTNPSATLYLGNALMNSDNPQEYREGLQRTVDGLEITLANDPENWRASLTLGKTLLAQGKFGDAEKLFKEVAVKQDTLVQSHIALANFYQITEDWGKAEETLRNAVERFSSLNEPHLAFGHYYWEKGQKEDAESAFLKAVDATPQDSYVHKMTGDFYASSGDDSLAIDHYETAKNLDNSLDLNLRLVYQFLVKGKLDKADSLLNEIKNEAAQSLPVEYLRARILLERDQSREATSLLEKWYPTSPNFFFNNSIPDLPLSFYLALAHYRAGDVGRASAVAGSIMPEFKNTSLVGMLLSEIAFSQRKYPESKRFIREVLKRDPASTPARIIAGRIAMAEKKWAEVVEIYSEILKREPQQPQAMLGVGIGKFGLEKWDEAVEILEKMYQIHPQVHQALSYLVDVKIRQGKTEEALQYCRDSISQNPDDSAPYLTLTRLLIDLGDTDQAKQILSKAKDNSRIKDSRIYFSLGSLQQGDGDFAAAKASYEGALDLNPDHPGAANNLAWLYVETGGDMQRAWNLAERANERYPNNPNIMDTLAWVYYKSGSYKKSIGMLEEAIKLQTDGPVLHFHLGMAQLKDGDSIGAQGSLRKSLEINADHQYADAARETLKKIEDEQGG